jgi:hypothetical protein
MLPGLRGVTLAIPLKRSFGYKDVSDVALIKSHVHIDYICVCTFSQIVFSEDEA